MSNRTRKQHKPTPARRSAIKSPAVWLVIAGAVLLLGALVFAATAANRTAAANRPPAASGAPKLVVDQEQIDFGEVAMNKPVTATFKITNEGQGPLQFTQAPYVEVLEGC
jgi:hypothetical protein